MLPPMADALPGPRGLPVLGVFPSFAANPLGFLLAMARRYGDRVAYPFAGRQVVQLSNPDDIDHVLLRAHPHLIKDEVTAVLAIMLGQGLVTSEGAVWKRQRKLAAPSFTARHVDAYGQAMVEVATAWADQQVDGATVDVHHEMLDVSRDIVLRCLFGVDPAPGYDISGPLHVFLEEFQGESQGLRRVLPSAIPTPGRRRIAAARKEIDAVVAELVTQAKARGDGDDVLCRLLAARDDDGRPMAAEQLRDEVVTFFTAGHETTAIALTQTFDLLGRSGPALARLQAEIDDVLGGRPPTVESLAELPYTRAVVNESLRLRGPIWAIGREVVDEVRLGDVRFAPGTQLFIPQWVVHHDPRWYPAPWAFRPERWLDGLAKRLPRAAFLPFGGGPRVCIGNHFALLETTLALVVLTQRLRLRLTDWRPPRLEPTVTLRPVDPVRMRVERR
mgnify:FL=1